MFRVDEGGDDIRQSEVWCYSRGHANLIHEFIGAHVAGGLKQSLRQIAMPWRLRPSG
jgi:hypothetical protein